MVNEIFFPQKLLNISNYIMKNT